MVERFCGRIEDIVQQARFESGRQPEETLMQYLERNLGHATPTEVLEKWRKAHPELFKKTECNHPGLDNVFFG